MPIYHWTEDCQSLVTDQLELTYWDILKEKITNFLTKEQVLFSNYEMLSSRKRLLTLLYNPDHLFSLTMIIHSNISKIIYLCVVATTKYSRSNNLTNK